jgi:hypothetical protein
MIAEDSASPASQPTGYNYDTFAEDLHKLVTQLELRDFALAGFSMGGGEVARYLGKYGSKGVSKAVFISSVPPFLLKTPDNPEGVDGSVFEGIQKAVAADRYAFFSEFFKNFYNTDLLLGKRVSEQTVQASWNVAAGASATACLACVAAWHEDFRKDLTRVDVPTLVIQGDADRILPIGASGLRTAKLIKGARFGGEGRAALHHLDPRGRSEPRAGELPEGLEAAHEFELLAGQQRDARGTPQRHPTLGIRRVQRVFNEQRVHRFHGLGDGDRAGRIELVVAMHGDVDVLADGLAAVGVAVRIFFRSSCMSVLA